jgi:hypothetical protein
LIEIDANLGGDMSGKVVPLGSAMLWRRGRLPVLHASSAAFVVLAKAAILVSYIS